MAATAEIDVRLLPFLVHVGIVCDVLHTLVLRQVFGHLHLKALVLRLPEFHRFRHGEFVAAEGLPLVDNGLHLLLNLAEVIDGDRLSEEEIKVAASIDGGPDGTLRSRPQLFNRLGEDVRQ